MKTLSLILFCTGWSFSSSYSQTIVIFKRTKNSIYLAADSRAATSSLNAHYKDGQFEKYEIVETYSDSSCKIQFSKDVGVAMLGLFSSMSFDCALQTCNNNESMLAGIKSYIECYKPKLTDTLERIRLKSQEQFDKMIDPIENTLTETLFFGFAADTPFLYYVYFERKDPAYTSGKVEITFSAQVIYVDQYCLGKKEAIVDSIKNPATWKRGIIPTIKKFAAIATEKNPKTVGGPIDIVMVTRKNRTWIQRKHFCPK